MTTMTSLPNDTTSCPSCRQAMTRMEFDQNTGGKVALDLCFNCRGIWFDRFESVRLSSQGIVELFKQIHAHGKTERSALPDKLRCPRCYDALSSGQDVSRYGRFNYYRCLQNHGRFTVFAQFMTEKGFVRQLFPAEIKALAARIGTINCTSCGAPVDIRTESACSHCKAPISILDPAAVEKALAGYRQAEKALPVPDPEALADALFAAGKERQAKQALPPHSLSNDLFASSIGLIRSLLER